MKYGSVCSGIEAATVAWHPLGWKPSFFSEIDKFPQQVLRHHYPSVPCHGDFTTIGTNDYEPIQLLVGGTPCQSFSVAGLRKGLSDHRGNLSLEFIRLAERLSPRWVLWENVPGVLSIDNGRAFGSFLGGMAELGYGFAYRVLDAQYFGVPQRRRRVFVVGYLGDWRPAAAVLFERESLRRDITPRREARKSIAGTIAKCSFTGGAGGRPDGAAAGHFIEWSATIAPTLNASFGSKLGLENQHINEGGVFSSVASTLVTKVRYDAETETLIPCRGGFFDGAVDTLTSNGDAHSGFRDEKGLVYGIDEECNSSENHFGTLLKGGQGGTRQTVAYGIQGNTIDRKPENGGNGLGYCEETSPTLTKADKHAVAYPINTQIATRHEALGEGTGMGIGSETDPAFTLQAAHSHAVAFQQNQLGEVRTGDVAGTINQNSNASGRNTPMMQSGMKVRRLTPIECEKLQGFPVNYTKISDKTPDGNRYKALGNSFAVPVVRWIGERIQKVEDIINGKNT